MQVQVARAYMMIIRLVLQESEINENPQSEDDTNEDDTVYGLISVISLPLNAVRNVILRYYINTCCISC